METISSDKGSIIILFSWRINFTITMPVIVMVHEFIANSDFYFYCFFMIESFISSLKLKIIEFLSKKFVKNFIFFFFQNKI